MPDPHQLDLELLRLHERVEIALQLGESHFREFKSGLQGPPDNKTPRSVRDVCVDIAETLVAFANADGGELIVGVEDDGTVLGVEYSESQIAQMFAAPKTHVHADTPLPTPRAVKVLFGSKWVVYFSIPKGTGYIYLTSNGRCIQRRDRESVPIASENIQFSRTEVASREYDRAFVDGANITDLHSAQVSQVAEVISRGMSVEKFLQHMELAEFDGTRFRLRRAALLLFARHPAKWHPRSQVRLLRINGSTLKTGEEFNVIVDQEATDNIMNLLESSWELLRPLLTETRFSAEARFRSQIMYPELACREALVNAIAHRDYSAEGRGVEVHVYTDRLEIKSPGGLLSSIQIDDLMQLNGVHQSRNSLIARVLRETGYMRELGEGMRRMFELMRSNDLQPPELRGDNTMFSVTLHHRYIYTREEKLWLDGFQALELTHDEKTIVRLGYDGHMISPREIWDAVGIVDTDYYRRLLVELRKKGVLQHAVNKLIAKNTATRKRISVKEVPRFLIKQPPVSTNPAVVTEVRPKPSDSRAEQAKNGGVVPPRESPSAQNEDVMDTADYSEIYVANIPFDMQAEDLEEIFSQFGEVVESRIPRTPWNNRSKGYAFVEFQEKAAAERAIAASMKVTVKGRPLTIRNATRRSLE